MFGFGKKRLVGVDIGTASIKLVELSRTRKSGHFNLETYGIANLTYSNKNPKQGSPLDVTVNTLGKLMEKANVKSKKIVASLPTSTVFVTVIEIPVMEEGEERKAIEHEAKKIIPIPIEDVTVSWNVVPTVGDQREGYQSILLTAVPNHVISNYINVFQKLKLEPQAIEVEATALARSLIGQDVSTVLIIDIGSKTSTVNLINGGYIYFSKNINVGGEAITKSIAQNLNVNVERAEQFKKTLGLSGALEKNKVPKSLQPILESLKSEVEQVMHLTQGWGRSIEKIIITGGGGKLKGLDKYLESSFNVSVSVGNPWARVVVPEKIKSIVEDLGPSLSVSVGLAMREEE